MGKSVPGTVIKDVSQCSKNAKSCFHDNVNHCNFLLFVADPRVSEYVSGNSSFSFSLFLISEVKLLSLGLDVVYTDNIWHVKPMLLLISSQAKMPSGLSSHLKLMPTLNAVESSL